MRCPVQHCAFHKKETRTRPLEDEAYKTDCSSLTSIFRPWLSDIMVASRTALAVLLLAQFGKVSTDSQISE
jgi:hypothetical protein